MCFNSSACYAPSVLINPCFHCVLQLESGQRAPHQDAAGERALAAHTAHHHTMTREVQQAQQQATVALQHNCELEQALAASRAVSAARAGASWLSCLIMLQACSGKLLDASTDRPAHSTTLPAPPWPFLLLCRRSRPCWVSVAGCSCRCRLPSASQRPLLGSLRRRAACWWPPGTRRSRSGSGARRWSRRGPSPRRCEGARDSGGLSALLVHACCGGPSALSVGTLATGMLWSVEET